MPQWYVQSNHIGLFSNALSGTWGCVCRSEENYLGNLFASSSLQKDENLLTHCRNSMYNYDEVGWTWLPVSSDVSEVEISLLPAGNHRTY